MRRLFWLVLIFLAVGAINSALQYFLEGKATLEWGLFGTIVFLVIFLYISAHIKCGECGYLIWKKSEGLWTSRLRNTCPHCGAALWPARAETTFSRGQILIGEFLHLLSVGGALFLAVVLGSELVKVEALSASRIIALGLIATPVTLLLIGAWMLGSRLLGSGSR